MHSLGKNICFPGEVGLVGNKSAFCSVNCRLETCARCGYRIMVVLMPMTTGLAFSGWIISVLPTPPRVYALVNAPL